MFCPKCELEIKGDNKKECPICSSALVDSPFDVAPSSESSTEDDARLRELISDIDEKVSVNLDKADEKEGPSAEAFMLSGDAEDATAFDKDMTEELSDLGGELDSILDGLKDTDADDFGKKSAHMVTSGTAEGQSEFTEAQNGIAESDQDRSLQQESDELSKKLAEIGAHQEFEDEESTDTVSENVEDQTSREILDQALEDLDIAAGPQKKKSRAVPLLVLIVVVCFIAGGAYYYLTDLSGVATRSPVPPSPQVVKSDDVVPVAPPPEIAPEPVLDILEDEAAALSDSEAEPEAVPEEDTATTAGVEAVTPAADRPDEAGTRAKPETVLTVAPQDKPPVESQPEMKMPAAGRFAVHAGSYRKQDVAEGEARRLSGLGFDAYSRQTDLGDRGIWYRVMIGNFETREQALEVQKKLTATDSVPSRIVRQR
jgi:septal ring-binding cell division protein DamX